MEIPVLFNLAIEFIARAYAFRTSSTVTIDLIRFHRSGFQSIDEHLQQPS